MTPESILRLTDSQVLVSGWVVAASDLRIQESSPSILEGRRGPGWSRHFAAARVGGS
jgi:hypothetical protein